MSLETNFQFCPAPFRVGHLASRAGNRTKRVCRTTRQSLPMGHAPKMTPFPTGCQFQTMPNVSQTGRCKRFSIPARTRRPSAQVKARPSPETGRCKTAITDMQNSPASAPSAPNPWTTFLSSLHLAPQYPRPAFLGRVAYWRSSTFSPPGHHCRPAP